MLLFIVLCPIVAAILIVAGAPARLTALGAASITLVFSILAFSLFHWWESGFQFVSSFLVSTDWQIHFAFGLDGLSLVLLLLAAIVTLAAVWFTGKIDNYEPAFYACLLLISGGAIGAFASLDLFFF
jgi:NADH-quinone oxidoreductase subunit M